VSLLSGMTVRQALDAVAKSTSTFYQVTGPNTIVVVQDTPAKRREYTEEVVRQFTLQNADVKETMDALRVAGDARYISPITAINAIVVRDTPERVQIIGRFISQFDKARPEVIVDVEVLEVSRNQLRDYGIQLASPSGRLCCVALRISSTSAASSFPFTMCCQPRGCGNGHSASGRSVRFSLRRQKLPHRQDSAQGTRPARRGFRST